MTGEEVHTPHIQNTMNPSWIETGETLRLIDRRPGASTANVPVAVNVAIWDKGLPNALLYLQHNLYCHTTDLPF